MWGMLHNFCSDSFKVNSGSDKKKKLRTESRLKKIILSPVFSALV